MGVYLYRPVVARQRLSKHVPTATKNCWSRRFYAVHIISNERRRLVLNKTYYYVYSIEITNPAGSALVVTLFTELFSHTGTV
jgi:hypothetical protein